MNEHSEEYYDDEDYNGWDDGWDEEDLDYSERYRYCMDPDCINIDPYHPLSECYSVEDMEEYYKEGDRTTHEYKFGVMECLEHLEMLCCNNEFLIIHKDDLNNELMGLINE